MQRKQTLFQVFTFLFECRHGRIVFKSGQLSFGNAIHLRNPAAVCHSICTTLIGFIIVHNETCHYFTTTPGPTTSSVTMSFSLISAQLKICCPRCRVSDSLSIILHEGEAWYEEVQLAVHTHPPLPETFLQVIVAVSKDAG